MSTDSKNYDLICIGGGAAGYFCAMNFADSLPQKRVLVIEGGRRPLTKVKISGGGRCNVTHNCFEPKELVKNYPRGQKELIGPFYEFGPRELIQWFESRNIRLKTEADGRMFPATNDSQTIIDCFKRQCQKLGIETKLGVIVKSIERSNELFLVTSQKGDVFHSRNLLLATGSSPSGYTLAQKLGHSVHKPVPSLFTFEINDKRLTDLSGLSFPSVSATLSIANKKSFRQQGPLLITHWGLSGPSVLKLSAFAARELFESNYQATLMIDFCPAQSAEDIGQELLEFAEIHSNKEIRSQKPFQWLPRRYWERIIDAVKVEPHTRYKQLPKRKVDEFVQQIKNATFQVSGKGVFKEEFVTCGGIELKEVNFKTMQSKIVPNLYFAGEILNIDGITGGFNFQNAWTGGFIAAKNMSR